MALCKRRLVATFIPRGRIKDIGECDVATGKNMDRKGWAKLQAAIDSGQVSRLVVWRLDRLGRTASGLCKLFENLQSKRVRVGIVTRFD